MQIHRYSTKYVYMIVFWQQVQLSKQLYLRHPSLAVHFADSQHDSLDVQFVFRKDFVLVQL